MMLDLPNTGVMSGNLGRAVSEWDGDPVVGAYLWWWSHGEAGKKPEDRWGGRLDGVSVELRGPADFVPVQADLVARILRGVEADQSCDIGYCNHEYWPRVDKSQVRMAMVSKGGESSGMRNGRVLWDSRVLFHPGHLNMIPGAMLDLLTGGAKVTVTGATFYALGRDYVDDAKTTAMASIMHHNPGVNRRIVKNLFEVGAVAAGGATAKVLSWSHEEYGRALLAHRTVD
jgi:hypothetical protein